VAQYEMNLRDYWLIIRRRRMWIIGTTLVTMLFSLWLARQKVPVYQATATVKFEQSTNLSGLLVEVLSYSSSDNIETQATLIKSYPVLEEVARRLGRLPQATGDTALREGRSYQATLDAIGSKIRTNRVPNTSILEITATSVNPREARDLANTVAEVYRDYNKQNRNGRLTEARKFIEAQLKEVEGRVRRAEEEVWAFRDANRVISPGAESTVLLSLFTQVRGDMEKARQQRTELEQLQARLARTDPASMTERVYVESTNPGLLRLQTVQTELTMERTQLALEVTDKHPRLQAIDDRLREVRFEMRREIGAQVATLKNREDILARQMGELMQKNREVPAVELGLQRLQRDAKVNDDLLTLLKTKHQEALIKESEGVEEVALVRPATDPGAPVGSDTLNTMLVGGLLGLMLGLVLAFVQETLDTSIGTIEDVESYLDVKVLGIVPHIDPRETMDRLLERRPALAHMDQEALQSHSLLITHFDPKSPVAEAYRTLRTNIQFQRMERGGKVLVVTSPTLQEGKTTTIVNLALTMAQSGQKTLLVGANMRRPSIYRFFGIAREPGLSDILVGNAQWRDCVRGVADILMGRFEMEDIMASPGLDNLHIIEAGPIPANPSELLSTSAMRDFLQAVSAEYDIVLIDTPPILPVTDSAIVAGQVDGVLLVYQAGKVGRLVLKRAKAHLESARAKVWGIVLNDLQTEISGYTYTHYYTHYYGEETGPDAPRGSVAQRAVSFVRGKLGLGNGSGSHSTTAAPSSVTTSAPPDETGPRSTSSSRAMKKKVLLGVAVVVALGIGGVGVWVFGVPGSGGPRALLRQRLEPPPRAGQTPSGQKPAAKPAPPGRPTAPAAPAMPAAPPTSVTPGGPPTARPTAPPVVTSPTPAATPLPVTPPPSAAPSPVTLPPVTAQSATRPLLEPPPPPLVTQSTPASPRPPITTMPPAAATPRPDIGTSPTAVPPVTAGTPPLSITPPAPSATAPIAPPADAAKPSTETKAPPRFAVVFGPFTSPADAEKLERTMIRAGHQTVRTRQDAAPTVYAVLIERVPTAHDARTLINVLREQGMGEAIVASTDPLVVRVGELRPLRGAVQLAERVRKAGYQVRVAAQPNDRVAYIIRHGSFATRDEAEARSRDLARLSVPAAQVVQVR
jgi:polysaccharide biosynthesis transport protein